MASIDSFFGCHAVCLGGLALVSKPKFCLGAPWCACTGQLPIIFMQILENVILAPYTTFKIGGPARWFCDVQSIEDAEEALAFARKTGLEIFILGGGSNLLISDRGFNGLVMRVLLKGKSLQREDSESAYIKIAAGENWDSVVAWTVDNGWWGAENLSHIPGSCGAIAVQNVGAYGQEASRLIQAVRVLDTQNLAVKDLANPECGFSYRHSIFNSEQKGRYIILDIVLKLSKQPQPLLGYRDIEARFKDRQPDLRAIREAVIDIRNAKYPFPSAAKNGNAGSFFKNLQLPVAEYETFLEKVAHEFGRLAAEALDKKKFPDGPGSLKLPAAAIIDLCGLKDLSNRGAKINHNQPLVIINETGQASASDVLGLAGQVVTEVWRKLGVKLSVEPVLLGFDPEETAALFELSPKA